MARTADTTARPVAPTPCRAFVLPALAPIKPIVPAPQQASVPKPTRRALLGGAAAFLPAAAGASVPALAASGEQPDAALIRLCAEIEAVNDEAERLGDAPFWGTPGNDEALGHNAARWRDLADQANALRATTLEGVQARARAIGAIVIRTLPDLSTSESGREPQMLAALADDLLPICAPLWVERRPSSRTRLSS